MGETLLESYKNLQTRLYTIAVLFVIVVIALIVMYYLYSLNVYSHSVSNANYSRLYAQFNSSQSQLAVAVAKYNNAEYNLTTPYTVALYNDHTVNIPKKNVSASNTTTTYVGATEHVNITNIMTYYTSNFSFTAQYPGYLLINATGTGVNTQTNTSWEFIVSSYNIIPNGTMKYYEFQSGSYTQGPYSPVITNRGIYKINFDQNSPKVVYAPTVAQGQGTVEIPIAPGTEHVWIANLNNQSISVTFSAEYVGFHTH